MAVKDPKELFVQMLSELRQGTERTSNIVKEMSEGARRREVKEALDARAFVLDKNLASIDQCFNLIGEKPAKVSGRLLDMFLEDFRKERDEIQSPEAKILFTLAKANHLIHMRIAEYVALIAAADVTGNYGVGVLLESCLGDTLAFVDRTRRLIREQIHRELAA
jgi:ferritin-like metal-binding protein YciE